MIKLMSFIAGITLILGMFFSTMLETIIKFNNNSSINIYQILIDNLDNKKYIDNPHIKEDFTISDINGNDINGMLYTSELKSGKEAQNLEIFIPKIFIVRYSNDCLTETDSAGEGLTIEGTNGEDKEEITGTEKDDDITLGDGDEKKVNALEGNDTVTLSSGDNNTIDTGIGDDTVILSDNDGTYNTIYLGDGLDTFTSDSSKDNSNTVIYGGKKNDVIELPPGDDIELYGEECEDNFYLEDTSNAGNNYIINGGLKYDILTLDGDKDDYSIDGDCSMNCDIEKVIGSFFGSISTGEFDAELTSIEKIIFADDEIEYSQCNYFDVIILASPKRLDDVEEVDTDGNDTYDDLTTDLYKDDNDDSIEINDDQKAKIYTYGGDDIINIDDRSSDIIDLGEGNNRLDIDGSSRSSIYMGDGNDKIRIGEELRKDIDLKEGNNILNVLDETRGTIKAGDGNNIISVGLSTEDDITLGDGDNFIYIKEDAEKSITLGNGNNKILIKGENQDNIILGDGNNILNVFGDSNGIIQVGNGINQLYLGNNANYRIDLGDSDDYLYIKNDAGDKIYCNAGEDRLIIGGSISDIIDGGDNVDSIELRNYTLDDRDNNVDNLQDYIINFENIKVSDGTVKGEDSLFNCTSEGLGGNIQSDNPIHTIEDADKLFESFDYIYKNNILNKDNINIYLGRKIVDNNYVDIKLFLNHLYMYCYDDNGDNVCSEDEYWQLR